jgi:hypothetical protein
MNFLTSLLGFTRLKLQINSNIKERLGVTTQDRHYVILCQFDISNELVHASVPSQVFAMPSFENNWKNTRITTKLEKSFGNNGKTNILIYVTRLNNLNSAATVHTFNTKQTEAYTGQQTLWSVQQSLHPHNQPHTEQSKPSHSYSSTYEMQVTVTAKNITVNQILLGTRWRHTYMQWNHDLMCNCGLTTGFHMENTPTDERCLLQTFHVLLEDVFRRKAVKNVSNCLLHFEISTVMSIQGPDCLPVLILYVMGHTVNN